MGQIIANSEQFETYIETDHRGQVLQRGLTDRLLGWREVI